MAKKQKAKADTQPTPEQQQPPSTPDAKQPDEPAPKARPRPIDTAQAQASSSSNAPSPRPGSWYNGGSWRAKASPVAQIARESISVAKGATSEASEEQARRPSVSVSKSMRGSRKTVPLLAEATKIHATSGGGDKSRPRFPSEEKLKGVDVSNEATEQKEEPKPEVIEAAPLPPAPSSEDAKSTASGDTRQQSGAWFGWWSRPDGYGSDAEKAKSNKRRKLDTDEASSTPLPGSPEAQPVNAGKEDDIPVADSSLGDTQVKVAAQWEGLQPEMAVNHNSTRSWFGLWSSTQNEQAAAEASASKHQSDQQESVTATATAPEVTVTPAPPAVEEAAKPAEPAKQKDDERPKATGWAFWSSDKPKDDANPESTQKEVGQLAVADTPSQSHPEAAQFNEQREDQQPKKPPSDAAPKRSGSLLRPSRGRAEKAKDSAATSSETTPAESSATTPAISQVPTPTDTPPRDDSEAPTAVKRGKLPQSRPNLILPTFRDLYSPMPNPGYVERLGSYLAQTLRLPGSEPALPPQHLYIAPNPPKVKKAIAIGVHGFFPAPLIQKVLGQPTGTSIRFTNYAAASIKAWCEEHQPSVKDVEIEKVALEGEGFVADRVTTLWKLLLNWLSHLRQADFILIAAHSQGVPVAFMLLAKLIQLGCLGPNVRLGICAMAGINLGPFLEYKSRLWGGSALELFEFCDAHSKVSKAYAEALDTCLRSGVRVTFVGSLDDQLVSLESSLYAPLSHPYVSRAVFIDGRLHVPNFLTHLVVFALKLRNMGVSDHGLLRELSAPLAGSLVGGEGHSRVYDDPAVYQQATEFALETAEMAPPNANAIAAPTAASSLIATDVDRARALAAARRASLSGYPTTAAQANSIRRGSISASTNLPGIAPVLAHYEPPSSSSAPQNPFYLPWAVRGMLEEEAVKRDPKLMDEVRDLVAEFEDWKPSSKVLKDVRWRLEGVRNLL